MNDLLARAIAAHGGLERWNTFNKVTATTIGGGGLRPMKGLEADMTPRERTVTLHEETTYISPFGQPDWRMAFTPDRVAIETSTGAVVSERSNPRAAFAGHVLETVWDPLHNAYFSGYTIWTYLTTPFLMAMPGFEVAEISPWQGRICRTLNSSFTRTRAMDPCSSIQHCSSSTPLCFFAAEVLTVRTSPCLHCCRRRRPDRARQ